MLLGLPDGVGVATIIVLVVPSLLLLLILGVGRTALMLLVGISDDVGSISAEVSILQVILLNYYALS